jgi:hypothetical protein
MVLDMIFPFKRPYTAPARLFQLAPQFPFAEIWAQVFPDALSRG